jgi:phospholipase D1/2
MAATEKCTNSIRQIVTEEGEAYQAAATENIWVGYDKVFSHPIDGNKVKAFTTGKEYFADLIEAMNAASSEIYITGWQVNWDALLAPGVRLFDIIYAAAQRGIKIYVMPWDDTEPIQTYDDATKYVLQAINKKLGTKNVFVQLAASMADDTQKFFSHHQKCVVIDRKIAYIGGIDLAYGRYDDATYDLQANADGRQVLNRYNAGLAPGLGETGEDNIVDTDLLDGGRDNFSVPVVKPKSDADITFDSILNGAWQVPYTENGAVADINKNIKVFKTLAAATQPRQPWQDVHCRIEGGSVADLLKNFIWRWNTIARANKQPKLAAAPTADSLGKPGGCSVQVLRSAAQTMRNAETAIQSSDEKAELTAGVQSDIHEAMKLLIEKSNRFIYIENQFFVSAFGRVLDANENGALSGPATQANVVKGLDQTTGAYGTQKATKGKGKETEPPVNEICKALGDRIDQAICDIRDPNFHVYITLPVHPEGALNKGAIMTQVHWTMQSLSFGSQSLLNRIRRSLRARELADKCDKNWKRAYEDSNTEYENINIERCFKYVTLLNLRNYKLLPNGRYITEQIYVHSKLMIVDDRFVLMGSANINDRSLLGRRDSELAVLIVDTDHFMKDVNGKNSNKLVRRFAHEMRIAVWKKIFGITGGERPAANLAAAIEQPGKPESWGLIQKQAEENAKLYEGAFPFVPRSYNLGTKTPASIWPVWRGTSATSLMPFEDKFWSAPQHTAAASKLTSVKGYITALPYLWTQKENNNFGYSTQLMVKNDVPTGSDALTPKTELASKETTASKTAIG